MTARTGETPTPSIDKDIMEKARDCWIMVPAPCANDFTDEDCAVVIATALQAVPQRGTRAVREDRG
jgi:hypothetical protein